MKKKLKQWKIENEVRKADFENMFDILGRYYDGREIEFLKMAYYYLINFHPTYEGLISEYWEMISESFDRGSYGKFIYHIGRLCIYLENKNWADAYGEIEDLYVVSAQKKMFFQPKYMYNIIKILSCFVGGQTVLRNKEDEYSYEKMVKLVNENSKEFRYVKKKISCAKIFAESLDKNGDYFQKGNYNNMCRNNYKESMSAIKDMMDFTEEYGCKKSVLVDYFMDIIKNDIKYDYLANVVYGRELTEFRIYFPKVYYDQQGKLIELDKRIILEEIDFSNVLIFSVPWKKERVVKNLVTLSNEKFLYDKSNHKATYFPEINLCYVTNGNHSIAMGIKNNQGSIMAEVFNLQPLFGKVDTDGVEWFSMYDKTRILGKLSDFRIGLLFKLAEMKYNLKEKMD